MILLFRCLIFGSQLESFNIQHAKIFYHQPSKNVDEMFWVWKSTNTIFFYVFILAINTYSNKQQQYHVVLCPTGLVGSIGASGQRASRTVQAAPCMASVHGAGWVGGGMAYFSIITVGIQNLTI